MRLSPEKASFITSGLKSIDPGSRVFLFGSRTDDSAKGGDIDILWLTPEKPPEKEIRAFRIEFFKLFGWQKLDIVNYIFGQNDVFKQIALSTSIEL